MNIWWIINSGIMEELVINKYYGPITFIIDLVSNS